MPMINLTLQRVITPFGLSGPLAVKKTQVESALISRCPGGPGSSIYKY